MAFFSFRAFRFATRCRGGGWRGVQDGMGVLRILCVPLYPQGIRRIRKPAEPPTAVQMQYAVKVKTPWAAIPLLRLDK